LGRFLVGLLLLALAMVLGFASAPSYGMLLDGGDGGIRRGGVLLLGRRPRPRAPAPHRHLGGLGTGGSEGMQALLELLSQFVQ
jgi:hypothetical protein